MIVSRCITGIQKMAFKLTKGVAMRKVALVCLALGIGLAFASGERWLSPTPTHHYTIPEPEHGIFPPAPEVFLSVTDTFKYDDNMPASAWAWNQGGNGWGVKFISPASSFTLSGALIHFYSGWPVPGGTRAMVKVYADDGPGGSPGTEIWHSETLNITRGQWNYIPIGEPIVGTNYYIFYVQVDSYPICPGLSIDAANNAPSHRMWSLLGGAFSEDARRGEWLIRSVVEWDPPTTDAATLWFATNMPMDTLPNVNLTIRATIKNLGTDPLQLGTPVRLKITGPQSYTYEDTMTTSAALQRGQTAQMNFSPAWRIPSVTGNYQIKVWTEAAGEQYPADDTIIYDLSVARWIEYANFNNPRWLTWAGPERATKFNPADFGVQYPVGLGRVRSQFYLHPSYPWPDSTFRFKIYSGDGSTLLYESGDLEAPAGAPGSVIAYDLDSLLIFTSGEFYVAVAPVHSSGHPSSLADDTSNNRSYYGAAGSWMPWTNGELFISASVQGGVGVEEGFNPNLRNAQLVFTNPATDQVEIRWQVPKPARVQLALYDATGRLVRNLYQADEARSGRVAVDLKSLAAGIYLVRLESPAGSTTHKLTVNR
ncbi:T9SS type A sorting domain-containing protein [candidate division WOR-3 bacterium]|nr:T9SS type A sorting domain-containing protein [candidate division WOR-3 bacterium]